ncbi:hypothetical protein G1C97_0996 [Bifidobacterium sp. DSM 109959]|uniref:Uncharacterized protein n=1 Tax=Bifidobacterium olomucense TaxID=2675324 RepID=A0A7Y0EX79_9BIFI|nr:hypothetical protein [Bifidobacterium sp. DSM 109959]
MNLIHILRFAAHLFGFENRSFKRVVHADDQFMAAKGEDKVSFLADALETGLFKPIPRHIHTTFRYTDITSFQYAPRVELYQYYKSCIAPPKAVRISGSSCGRP